MEPDWERLRAIAVEQERLAEAGLWDRAAFERLAAEATAAARGHGEFTEFLVNAADPSWLE